MDKNNFLFYFSKNVAYLRRVNNLTQKEMAKIMGISVDTVRKLEKGIPTPGMDCFAPLRVSEYFDISLDTLWKSELET